MSYVLLTQEGMKGSSSSWPDFSATSVSELAVSGFRSVGYFELPWSTCPTMTGGVQAARWLPASLQFCAEEIHHVLLANKDGKSARHILQFCSCRSLTVLNVQTLLIDSGKFRYNLFSLWLGNINWVLCQQAFWIAGGLILSVNSECPSGHLLGYKSSGECAGVGSWVIPVASTVSPDQSD